MEAFAEKFASELSYGTLRLLELGCMLALEPELLLLDEPASGISQKETEALGPLLRDIKEQTGATILMIEHDMPLIMSLSDWIYCLDAGQNLSEGTPEEVQADPGVVEAYLGTPAEQRKVAAQAKRKARGRGRGRRCCSRSRASTCSTTRCRCSTASTSTSAGASASRCSAPTAPASRRSSRRRRGLVPTAGGHHHVEGRRTSRTSPPSSWCALGLGQVPGGRGLFPTLTVGENLRMGGYIFHDEKQVDAEVERVMKYFPWIARPARPAGGHAVGRRAAAARHRPRPDRPARAADDRRAVARPGARRHRAADGDGAALHEDEGLTVVIVEQQASFALGYTDRAYFLEKGEVRYEGPSAGLTERADLLRSVFLAGRRRGLRGGRDVTDLFIATSSSASARA